MDREELNNQIIEFEKRTIKREGLEWWLKEQACQPDEIKNSKSYRRRYIYLRRWAKENGLDGLIPESNSNESDAQNPPD